MKTNVSEIKMKTLITLILLCTVSIQAQVLVYKRTVHSTVIGDGFRTKSSVSGLLVVDVGTGAAAEFDTYSKSKEFLSRSRTFMVGTVHGGPGIAGTVQGVPVKEYTVFAEVAAGTDTFGPYRMSYTAKGLDVQVEVGWGKRPVPRTMRSNATDIYSFGTEYYMEDETGTLIIDSAATQNANAVGHTLDEVAAAIRSKLIESGFTDIQPPA
jgi:hypothetical protein